MVWWAILLITAGFQLLSGLLSKTAKPKPEDQPKLPINDGSSPIPVVFGECLITSPFVMDYFDYRVEPIKKKNPATFFLTSVIIGYRYYLGIVFGLCYAHGDWFTSKNPTLREITIDNRRVVFNTLHPPTLFGYEDYSIDKQSFFGSKDREGGIATRIRFYDGSDPAGFSGYFKESDPYWEGQRGLTLPHYKNLCYAVWYGPSAPILFSGGRRCGYIGNSTALWPIGFKVSRYPIYFGTSGTASIGDTPSSTGQHANPVECLVEVLTNADYGAGISISQLDTTSWTNAVSDVWGQGLAFSYLWNNVSSIEDMAGEILRHIDGVIWTDLQSGKIKIKLAHEESLVGVLTYTNDDFIEITSFTRGSWEDTRNEIKISYPDHTKADFENSTFSYYESANFALQGEPKVESITFSGCPTPALASRLAAREARVVCRPFVRFRGKIDRKLWNASPGSLFKFTWPEQAITDLVMRITNLKLGTITDGTITIEAVEDVFHTGEATFGTPTSTIWTDPLAGDAVDATAEVGEVPYFYQSDSFNRVFGVAARPNTAHVSYDAYLDGESTDAIEVDFTPRALLVADLPQLANGDYDTVGFSVDGITDGDFIVAGTAATIAGEAASLAIIGDPSGDHEWIAFESVTGTTTKLLDNVWRGLLDTPPRSWPADTPVWFFSVGAALMVNTLADSQSITFESLTRTMQDQLETSEATNHGYTVQRRALRPLPPYYVLFEGDYDNEIWVSGDLDFTWREHSRLTMTQVIKQSHADEASEVGVTWEVDVRGDAGTVEATYTGLVTPAFTYDAAMLTADFGSPQLILTFDIYSKRDGLRSLYPWKRRVLDFNTTAELVTVNGDLVTVNGDLVTVT